MHANSYLAVQISIRSPHRQEQHNSRRGCKCGNVLRLTMKAAHHPALGLSVINLVSLKGFRVLASLNARSWIHWLLFIVMDFYVSIKQSSPGPFSRVFLVFFFSFVESRKMKCVGPSAPLQQDLPRQYLGWIKPCKTATKKKMEFPKPVLSKSSGEGAKWGLITA